MLLKKKYISQNVIYKRVRRSKSDNTNVSKFCRNCEHAIEKLSGFSCDIINCSALTIHVKLKPKTYLYVPI